MPLPAGATVGRSGRVTWTVKGKKRTGKLSGKTIFEEREEIGEARGEIKAGRNMVLKTMDGWNSRFDACQRAA